MCECPQVPDRNLQLDMVNVTMTDNAVTRVGYFGTLVSGVLAFPVPLVRCCGARGTFPKAP